MSKPNASAAAIKLARANQLDIGQIKGTGSKDQVTKADVEMYITDKGRPADVDAAKRPTDPAAAQDPADPAVEHAPPVAEGDTGKPADTATPVSPQGQPGPSAEDNGPTAAAEKRAEDEAAARAAATEAATKGTLEIARVQDNLTSTVWWCPYCDNSQPGEHRRCGGCGAERQGDNLVAEVGEKVTAP